MEKHIINDTSKVKVFGVGLQKTGTTTLGACLSHLGYNHKTYDRKALWDFRKNRVKSLKETMDDYDSFEDEPWASLYELADVTYPDAKFILTVRKNSAVWFDSLAKHCDRILFNEHRKYLFGSIFPRENRDEIIKKYEKHNAAVINHFKGREEKLLIISFDGDRQEDAWKKICSFLRCEIPDIPIPKKNSAPKKQFPKQTRFLTYLYIPKYLWIVIKHEIIRPIYRMIKT